MSLFLSNNVRDMNEGKELSKYDVCYKEPN